PLYSTGFSFILFYHYYTSTVYGQLQDCVIYSSSTNDLLDYKSFDGFGVDTTYDGSLLIMFKNNENHYKYINAQLPDGSVIDINLNVLDKNVTIIFLVTMQYYFYFMIKTLIAICKLLG
ncbi:27874_t:CDS:1, partial [Gigaspora margarita]